MIKKIVCLSGFCVSVAIGAYAQTAYLKIADDFYNGGDYYSASVNYEKYLSGKVEKGAEYHPYVAQRQPKATAVKPAARGEVVYKLAESYYNLHFFSKAEPLFKEAIGPANPLAAYYYAKTLRANNKPDEAAAAFNQFIAGYTTADEYAADAKHELQNLAFAKTSLARKDLRKFKVGKSALNSTGATYAPTLMSGTLTFTSTRPDSGYSKKNPYTNKLYKTGSDMAAAEMLPLEADSKMEQGVASFSPDGNKLFVTKWTYAGGKKATAIYTSTKSGSKWSDPVALGEAVNATGANAQQPFVTTDGKYLLFSSDRTGGMGKFDLWYVNLDAAGVPTGDAKNIGSINTAGDDQAPYYHSASKTLVFATNGRVGMGGFDLFSATGDVTGFATPVNIGYPVNSVKDDIYYTSTNAASPFVGGVFSSDRESPCCLELYAFDKLKFKKNISGQVVDCKDGSPVSGATVKVTNPSNEVLGTLTTDGSGRYTIALDGDLKSLTATASAEGYDAKNITFNSPDEDGEDVLSNPSICITKPEVPIEVNKTIVLANVLYDLASAKLRKSSYASLDTLVDLMKQYPEMAIELSSHTDALGSDAYNQKLSERRAKSCVDYIVSKGIDASRLTAKGYGETMPVEPNTIDGKDNPAGREKNRRTEFKILHY